MRKTAQPASNWAVHQTQTSELLHQAKYLVYLLTCLFDLPNNNFPGLFPGNGPIPQTSGTCRRLLCTLSSALETFLCSPPSPHRIGGRWSHIRILLAYLLWLKMFLNTHTPSQDAQSVPTEQQTISTLYTTPCHSAGHTSAQLVKDHRPTWLASEARFQKMSTEDGRKERGKKERCDQLSTSTQSWRWTQSPSLPIQSCCHRRTRLLSL